MSKKADSPDELTISPEDQAARDAGDPVVDTTPVEVEKGELTDAVLHGGVEWPRGTKLTALKPKVDADTKERLVDLGLVAGYGDASE